MASSKVISNASQTNQDPPRQSSLRSSPLSSLLADLQNQSQQQTQPQTVTMDDLFKDIYAPPPADPHGASSPREESRSVEELWKEIVAGGEQRRERMTLEDFLTRAGAVGGEEVRENPVGLGPGVYPVGAAVIDGATQFAGFVNNGLADHQRAQAVGPAGGGARGKRRAVEEPPMDKATQQKQRRMIKNRESAARSRERKQAYTIELETLVTQLEEENARLRREEAEQNKKRLKQLMENLIPVEERKRSPRVLRRVRSVHW